ncbi:MAG TPA: hypothetical protein VGC53_04740 [Vicinamibacteria bacterium]
MLPSVTRPDEVLARFEQLSLLGRRVDLATPSSLKAQFRDRILKEAIRAA